MVKKLGWSSFDKASKEDAEEEFTCIHELMSEESSEEDEVGGGAG